MKKVANLLLLGALFIVGACSDNDKDEPDPIQKPEYPSQDVFETQIKNNLWEREDFQYETAEGVVLPTDLFGFVTGEVDNPYLWYFSEDKGVLCEKSKFGDHGYDWENLDYDPATGFFNGPLLNSDFVRSQFVSLEDGILTIKYYVLPFGDPGDLSDSEWAKEWNSFPYKDKVVNQRIYHVGKYHKVENPDIEEILSHYVFWADNPQ